MCYDLDSCVCSLVQEVVANLGLLQWGRRPTRSRDEPTKASRRGGRGMLSTGVREVRRSCSFPTLVVLNAKTLP